MVKGHLQDGFGDVPLQSCSGGCVSGWEIKQKAQLVALHANCCDYASTEQSQNRADRIQRLQEGKAEGSYERSLYKKTILGFCGLWTGLRDAQSHLLMSTEDLILL